MKKKVILSSVLTTTILFFSSFLNIETHSNQIISPSQSTEDAADKPLIFPIPSEVQLSDGIFGIDNTTYIMVPENPGESDIFLAELLRNEIVDKYEQNIVIANRSTFPDKDKCILIGDISNPLVHKFCEQKRFMGILKELGPEGYLLSVSDRSIVVAANNKNGALYGLESLRQVINEKNNILSVPCMFVRDSPRYSFRGIKLYLPGRENIPFFKRFIKDFAALYKFNKIILELNANMRLDRHPELNIGTVQFYRHLNNSRLDRPPGVHKEFQNSSHQDNADGEILEKEEVADIVNYIRKFNIEVIPELPSLTHAYYLLFGHKELAENMNQPYPDTYCPLKQGSYNIYFDVLDEYIDVIHPSIIHVGHDEWRMEKDLCDLCRGKDYGQLYADDLNKIHDYLLKKGIKTAIWGDHLLESVTQKDHQLWTSSTGYEYKIPGALTPEQVLKLIPKDIIIFNWFWDNPENDKQVSDFGFKQVYGNLRPDIDNWSNRHKTNGVMGGAPSSWAGTTEMNFGKDQILDFLGCANLLWSDQYLSPRKLAFVTEPFISGIYASFRGKRLPSDLSSRVLPVNISAYCNSSLYTGIDSLNIKNLLSGNISSGHKIFEMNPSSMTANRAISVYTLQNSERTSSVQSININKDPNSIIFLHACAREASNKKAYDMICNFEETSQLLGWYEIVYKDGFVETVPIRYGLNILDWKWRKRINDNDKPEVENSQNTYAYEATAVDCSQDDSDPVTFFAFEWENKRLGQPIKEINLKSVRYTKNNENAIILLAISFTENSREDKSGGIEKQ